MPLQVFIVDDSTVFRSQIRAALDGVPGVQVAGFASNGKLALDALRNKQVDVITLDLEMPVMNGLETLAELRKLNSKAKVIVFSSHTKRGAESTLLALSSGACDFLPKPSGEMAPGRTPADAIREVLLPKILQFLTTGGTPAPERVSPARLQLATAGRSPYPRVDLRSFLPKVVVIASSTGGPNALEALFSQLQGPLQCPIVIAQHMPPIFTQSLAERLGKVSGIPFSEAVHMEPLQAGRAYIAPGDHHLKLVSPGAGRQIALSVDQEPLRNSIRPAADFLFESAAEIFKGRTLGIVLTGMGADGKDGAFAIKQAGGGIIIQSKESCVVFGMPGAVHDAQAYDAIESIEGIARQLTQIGVCAPRPKAS